MIIYYITVKDNVNNIVKHFLKDHKLMNDLKKL